MSLLDELANTLPARPGPLCVVQQVRRDEGEDTYIELMRVLTAEGYTSAQKGQVLADHGYGWPRLTIERHTLSRITNRDGCVRCSEWLATVGLPDD